MRIHNLHISLIFILFLSFLRINAQTITLPIGSSTTSEGGATMVLVPGGDYIIGGYYQGAAMLTRTTSTGNVIWAKSIDFGSDNDYVMELMISSTNELIGIGNSRNGSGFNAYGFVFKMDLNGNIVWQRLLNCASYYLWAQGIEEMNNGNIRAVGSFQTNYLESYVVELDPANGGVIWDSVYVKNSYMNSWDESFYDIATHSANDASYIAGRLQTSGGQVSYRPSLSKLSATGEYEWSRIYLYPISSSGGRLYSFAVEPDGDSLVINILGKNGGTSPPFQCGLIKTDTLGMASWAKLYSGASGEDLRCYNIAVTPNGYVLAGWVQSGNKQLFLIKTDKQGNVQWSKSYGTTADEDIWLLSSKSRVIIDGNEVVTVGRTNGFGGMNDIYLVKADLNTGEILSGGCYNDLPITTTVLPSLTTDYPLTRLTLPVTTTTINPPANNLTFDTYGGAILESVTDTIISGDSIYLCNQNITLEAGWPSGASFLWNTGGTQQLETVSQSGLYSVDVSMGGCLIGRDSVWIFNDELDIDLGPDTNYCDNQGAVIIDAGITGLNYLWQDGSTNQTYTANSSGSYWVVASSSGCSGTDTINITFSSTPEIDLGPDTIMCSADPITIGLNNSSLSYLWNTGETTGTIEVSNTGWFWVVVDLNGCTNSDSIHIEFLNSEFPEIEDQIYCEDAPHFISLDDGNQYLWQDGSTDALYEFQNEGAYILETTNQCGSKVDTILVNYEFCSCDIYIPNAFTPDGDEFNNVFKVEYSCTLDEFELLIFNRWGEIIWESFDPEVGWDGTYMGRFVQNDTYVWKLRYKFTDQPVENREGHVNVIR